MDLLLAVPVFAVSWLACLALHEGMHLVVAMSLGFGLSSAARRLSGGWVAGGAVAKNICEKPKSTKSLYKAQPKYNNPIQEADISQLY